MANQSYLNMRLRVKSIIQRGFSLIEMVVVLSIIAVLAVLVTTQFSGDSAKATKLLSDSESIKKATLRFKMDTGYYPCGLNSLFSKNNFDIPLEFRSCSFSGGSAWAGPYLEKGVNSGLDGVQILVTRYQRGWGHAPESLGFPYIVSIAGVPEGVAKEFVKKCTGNELLVQNFSNGKCYAYPLSGNTPRLYHLSYFIAYQQ